MIPEVLDLCFFPGDALFEVGGGIQRDWGFHVPLRFHSEVLTGLEFRKDLIFSVQKRERGITRRIRSGGGDEEKNLPLEGLGTCARQNPRLRAFMAELPLTDHRGYAEYRRADIPESPRQV